MKAYAVMLRKSYHAPEFSDNTTYKDSIRICVTVRTKWAEMNSQLVSTYIALMGCKITLQTKTLAGSNHMYLHSCGLGNSGRWHARKLQI